MNHVVVDIATVSSWFIPMPHSMYAQQLLALSDAGHVLLHAPASVPMNMGEQLVRLKHRHPKLTLKHMQLVMEAVDCLPIIYTDDHILLSAALTIAIRTGVPLHQALSLALAIGHEATLCSADDHLLSIELPKDVRRLVMPLRAFVETHSSL